MRVQETTATTYRNKLRKFWHRLRKNPLSALALLLIYILGGSAIIQSIGKLAFLILILI
jgi:hypothetical protein